MNNELSNLCTRESAPSGKLRLLLDTNVWLDYYLGFRTGHIAALKLLNAANAVDACLLYATTTTKDLFFLISSDCKVAYRQSHDGKLSQSAALAASETAWKSVEHLSEIATAVACDQSDIWMAMKQRRLHNDYEDNLIIAAALRSEATCLITEDEKLLRHCPVATLDVSDALKFINGLSES